MPWRLEFSNVEQKDLGDLPEISMFSEVSLFFGKISVKGRLNWCFFHEDELFFLLFKTLIKSSKKIEFRTGMQVVDLWHGQLPKVLRIFRTRCVGKQKKRH